MGFRAAGRRTGRAAGLPRRRGGGGRTREGAAAKLSVLRFSVLVQVQGARTQFAAALPVLHGAA